MNASGSRKKFFLWSIWPSGICLALEPLSQILCKIFGFEPIELGAGARQTLWVFFLGPAFLYTLTRGLNGSSEYDPPRATPPAERSADEIQRDMIG